MFCSSDQSPYCLFYSLLSSNDTSSPGIILAVSLCQPWFQYVPWLSNSPRHLSTLCVPEMFLILTTNILYFSFKNFLIAHMLHFQDSSVKSQIKSSLHLEGNCSSFTAILDITWYLSTLIFVSDEIVHFLNILFSFGEVSFNVTMRLRISMSRVFLYI